jgi:hypothetical protein
MEWSRLRNPSLSQPVHAGPDEPVFLASADQRPPPESDYPHPIYPQTADVSRDRVVVEVALDNRLEVRGCPCQFTGKTAFLPHHR